MTRDVDEAVHLADRAIVLTRSPEAIAAWVEVGRPRTRADTRISERFLAVRNEVHSVIAGARR